MSTALLDSNIIIDHLNDIDKATAYLGSLSDWIISSLTIYEVMAGCTGDRTIQLPKARQFFSYCSVIPVDAQIADIAADIQRKKKTKHKMADYLIAATASSLSLPLATRNPSDFKGICKASQPYRI
jgi:predicted nucleic acid-binding protein